MISRVASRLSGYSNDAAIAKSVIKSFAKLLYYRAFAAVYGLVSSRGKPSACVYLIAMYVCVRVITSGGTAGHLARTSVKLALQSMLAA